MAGKNRPNLIKGMLRGTLAAKLGVLGPPLVIIAIGFAVAGRFIQPAPPDTLTIASGYTSGAYYAFAQKIQGSPRPRRRGAEDRNHIRVGQ